MSTPAQIEANRNNAQHSTGPITPEGKLRVSQNATRHGLNSTYNIVTPEDRPEFDAIVAELRADAQPFGALEEVAFDRLVAARWQMVRCRKLEADLQIKAGGADPLAHPETKKDAQLYARYYLRHEGSYKSALREFRELQTHRGMLMERDPECTERLPRLADLMRCARYAEQTQKVRMTTFKADLLEDEVRLSILSKMYDEKVKLGLIPNLAENATR